MRLWWPFRCLIKSAPDEIPNQVVLDSIFLIIIFISPKFAWSHLVSAQVPTETALINCLTLQRKERWKYANFKIVVNLLMDSCQ